MPTKSTKSTKSRAEVLGLLAKAGKSNAAKGVKSFYLNDKFSGAVAKALTLPTLTSAGLAKSGKVGRTAKDAEARRKFAKSIGAPLVSVAEIIHDNKGGEITHDRPENVVRVRLASVTKVMGKSYRFYAVRANAYAKDEVPKVYIVRL